MIANLHLAVIERVDKDNQIAGVFQLKFMKLWHLASMIQQ